jgi:hypothetical protein
MPKPSGICADVKRQDQEWLVRLVNLHSAENIDRNPTPEESDAESVCVKVKPSLDLHIFVMYIKRQSYGEGSV